MGGKVKKVVMGNAELSRLWNLSQDNHEVLVNSARAPSLDEYLKPLDETPTLLKDDKVYLQIVFTSSFIILVIVLLPFPSPFPLCSLSPLFHALHFVLTFPCFFFYFILLAKACRRQSLAFRFLAFSLLPSALLRKAVRRCDY